MPKRNIRLYVEDILDSVRAIQSFTADLSFEQFAWDRKTCSATIREYIVIGEAIVALIRYCLFHSGSATGIPDTTVAIH